MSDTSSSVVDDGGDNQQTLQVISGKMNAHCVRLKPGADLVPSLQECARQAMEASSSASGSAFVLTAVGSLSDVTLRMASAPCKDVNQKPSPNHVRRWEENFEIVSLVGTFAGDSTKHLHISLSNTEGNTIGGHLVAGTVFSTAEVVLGTVGGVVFQRKVDPQTGYRELVVSESSSPSTAQLTSTKPSSD
mmetsp:Transcript_30912/g.71242  ORF Transcript_30912/g.71242 Transcript_30912/m.71242 type:complete len:190 (+) Transcript_30912:173-742(+)